MDVNKDIYRKSIGKALTRDEGLNIEEAVGNFTGKKIGATFFRGVKPIDGVWVTPDVAITGACVMPDGYGVGDHRLFVVDMLTSSLIGHNPSKIFRAVARRLNTTIPRAKANYVGRLVDLIVEHRLVKRVGEADETSTSNLILKQKLDNIDNEQKDYMANSDKKFRKIPSGRILFSPQASK